MNWQQAWEEQDFTTPLIGGVMNRNHDNYIVYHLCVSTSSFVRMSVCLVLIIHELGCYCNSWGSLPLIFCIHVRPGLIYWGGYLPCRKDYKVMVFYV
jgi:hypothetical protein